MNRRWTWLVGIALLAQATLMSGCNRYQVIPNQLESQVSRDVTYEQIKGSPADYRGRMVVLGGEIISAKRLEDKTRIEVLQLPLSDDFIPTNERTGSKGRFYAFDTGHEILDPAILTEGTPVTIIGEVEPPIKGAVGTTDYEYPTVVIRDMTVWDQKTVMTRGPYPYSGYYYGYGRRPYHFMSGTRVGS